MERLECIDSIVTFAEKQMMKESPPLFKPSKSIDSIWNLTKTFLQTAVFWLVFLYVVPVGILKLEKLAAIVGFQPLTAIGWTLFFLFSVLGIYSGFTMSWIGKGTPLPLDCPNELVIQGPYRYVRNPMAVAGIGQGICVGLIAGSWLVILYSLIGAVIWHVTVRPMEERDLETRFGASYVAYKQKTRCWIPTFRSAAGR